ncbi:MAG: 30S ribosomal protein S18 [Pseudomonadota bacterium]
MFNRRNNNGRSKFNKNVKIKKKVCRFCVDKSAKIDYKEPEALQVFITERSKIIPSRISGNCAKHQREVKLAIKRARNLALLPYTSVTALANQF